MGLKMGRKNQGGGEKSGDESSPHLEQDLVHKPHFSKMLKPHLPHQLEKAHLRHSGSPKRGDALTEPKVDASATTETTTSAGQPSKTGLSLKNPFSRKKHLRAKRSHEKEVKQQADESLRAHQSDVPGVDGVFSVPPGAAPCKDITRQHTEAAAVAPVSYKSFGHRLDCDNDLQQLEQGHMARYGDFATFGSRDKTYSMDVDKGGFSVHRYDTRRGKVLQQVSLAGVCAEAAQAERQQAILETLAGKTWREKLQWGLDRKNLGNAYYQQKKIPEAISAYEDCLLALDFGSTPEEHQTIQQQLQLPVVLNLAACMLAIKCHQKCRALCDVALTLDSTCLKAVFRKGLACFHLGELGQARENLLQAYRFCCGHLPGAAEILPDGTENSKPDYSDPASLSLATAASKEFNGRPVGEEKDKFVKKVNHYLRLIATQEKQYAAACQNMFKSESKPGLHCKGTTDHQQSSFWKSPLGGFTLSPCNLCAKRSEKAQ